MRYLNGFYLEKSWDLSQAVLQESFLILTPFQSIGIMTGRIFSTALQITSKQFVTKFENLKPEDQEFAIHLAELRDDGVDLYLDSLNRWLLESYDKYLIKQAAKLEKEKRNKNKIDLSPGVDVFVSMPLAMDQRISTKTSRKNFVKEKREQLQKKYEAKISKITNKAEEKYGDAEYVEMTLPSDLDDYFRKHPGHRSKYLYLCVDKNGNFISLRDFKIRIEQQKKNDNKVIGYSLRKRENIKKNLCQAIKLDRASKIFGLEPSFAIKDDIVKSKINWISNKTKDKSHADRVEDVLRAIYSKDDIEEILPDLKREVVNFSKIDKGKFGVFRSKVKAQKKLEKQKNRAEVLSKRKEKRIATRSKVQLFFEITGFTYQCTFYNDAKVSTVYKIMKRDIPMIDECRLVYGGKDLVIGKRLCDFNIAHGCTISVLPRLKGGSKFNFQSIMEKMSSMNCLDNMNEVMTFLIGKMNHLYGWQKFAIDTLLYVLRMLNSDSVVLDVLNTLDYYRHFDPEMSLNTRHIITGPLLIFKALRYFKPASKKPIDILQKGEIQSEAASDVLASASVQTNSIMNGMLFGALRDLVTTLVGMKFFPGVSLSKIKLLFGNIDPKKSVVELFAMFLGSISSLVRAIEMLINGASLSDVLFGNSDPSELMNKSKVLLARSTSVYYGLPVEGRFSAVTVLTEMKDVIDALEAQMKIHRKSGDVFKQLNDHFVNLSLAKEKIETTMKSSNRMVPFAIVNVGTPGVGKSWIINLEAHMWSYVMGRKFESTHVYTKSRDKFWEGYDGPSHPIIKVSEPGSINVNLAKTKGDEVLEEILSLIDSGQYRLQMADIEGKKGTFAIPEIVLMDTNVEDMNMPALLNAPAAAYRRFLYCETRVRSKYTGADGVSLDPTKLGEYTDAWTFKVYSKVPTSNTKYTEVIHLNHTKDDGSPSGLDDLASVMTGLMRAHVLRQTKYKEKSNNIDISLYVGMKNTHFDAKKYVSPLIQAGLLTDTGLPCDERRVSYTEMQDIYCEEKSEPPTIYPIFESVIDAFNIKLSDLGPFLRSEEYEKYVDRLSKFMTNFRRFQVNNGDDNDFQAFRKYCVENNAFLNNTSLDLSVDLSFLDVQSEEGELESKEATRLEIDDLVPSLPLVCTTREIDGSNPDEKFDVMETMLRVMDLNKARKDINFWSPSYDLPTASLKAFRKIKDLWHRGSAALEKAVTLDPSLINRSKRKDSEILQSILDEGFSDLLDEDKVKGRKLVMYEFPDGELPIDCSLESEAAIDPTITYRVARFTGTNDQFRRLFKDFFSHQEMQQIFLGNQLNEEFASDSRRTAMELIRLRASEQKQNVLSKIRSQYDKLKIQHVSGSPPPDFEPVQQVMTRREPSKFDVFVDVAKDSWNLCAIYATNYVVVWILSVWAMMMVMFHRNARITRVLWFSCLIAYWFHFNDSLFMFITLLVVFGLFIVAEVLSMTVVKFLGAQHFANSADYLIEQRYQIMQYAWDRYQVKYMNKPMVDVSDESAKLSKGTKALIVIAGLTGGFLLWKMRSKKDIRSETEDVPPAESEQITKMLKIQDELSIPSKAPPLVYDVKKGSKIWKNKVSGVSTPYTGGMDSFYPFVLRNCHRLNINVNGNVRKSFLIGVSGGYALVNKHLFSGIDKDATYYVSALGLDDATTPKQLWNAKVDISQGVSVGNDLLLIPFTGRTFVDITKHFISEKDSFVVANGYLGDNPVTDIKFSGSITAKDQTGSEQYHEKTFSYMFPSHQRGHCGLPLMGQFGSKSAILGIHVAGAVSEDIAFAEQITREQLQLALIAIKSKKAQADDFSIVSESSVWRYPKPVLPAVKSVTKYEDIGGMVYYGRIGEANLQRSRLVKTKVFTDVGLSLESNFGIRVQDLSKFGVPLMKPVVRKFLEGSYPPEDGDVLDDSGYVQRYISPINQGFKKLNVRKLSIQPSILKKSIEQVYDRIRNNLQSLDLKIAPISIVEAINGVEGNPFIRPMNLSTAAGYGYKGKKRDHMILVDDEKSPYYQKYIPNDTLFKEITFILDSYREGVTVKPIFKMSLKDEARPIEKVFMGKTRMFYGSPLAFLIVSRMYLTSFYSLMNRFCEQFYTAIGIDMHSGGHKIYERILNSFDGVVPLVGEGDFGGYDTSNSPDISFGCNTIVKRLCKYLGYEPDHLTILDGLLTDNIYTHIEILGDVFMAPGLQPSGKYGTAEDNSIRNLLIQVLVWNHMPSLQDRNFFDYVNPITWGDDLLSAIHPEVKDDFNCITFSETCAKYIGMEFTTSDKGEVTRPFVELEDMSFLKRKFRQSDLHGKIVCPLDMSSILKMLSWTLPSDSISDEEQICATYYSACYELFFHCESETQYERVTNEIREAIMVKYNLTKVSKPGFQVLMEDLCSSSCGELKESVPEIIVSECSIQPLVQSQTFISYYKTSISPSQLIVAFLLANQSQHKTIKMLEKQLGELEEKHSLRPNDVSGVDYKNVFKTLPVASNPIYKRIVEKQMRNQVLYDSLRQTLNRFKTIRLKDSARRIQSEAGGDERKTGPVEKVATTAAQVLGAMSVIPYIGPVAKASSMMASGLGLLASIFGYSYPTMNNEPMRVKDYPYSNGAQVIGYDTGLRITLDPKQELTLDGSVVSSDMDEMTIKYICERESLVAVFEWNPDDAALGASIFECPVTPYLYATVPIGADLAVQPTTLAYAAQPFEYWRGSITFRLEIVCNHFHRGKLAILWEPNIHQQALISAELDINKQYTKVIDIQETQDVSFTVNWARSKAWLHAPTSIPEIGYLPVDTTAYESFSNGYLSIVPFNTLQSPDGSTITINVYVSSNDMNFNQLTSAHLPSSLIDISPESGVMDDSKATDLQIEENFTDVMGNEEGKIVDSTMSSLNVGQYHKLSLDDFFARPLLIAKYNVPLDTDVDVSYAVWKEYLNDSRVRAKLANYAFFSGTLHMRIAISGTPFHYGRMLVSYQPMAPLNQNLIMYDNNIVTLRGLKNVYLSQAELSATMNVNSNTPLEIVAPFICPQPAIRLYNETPLIITDATPFQDSETLGNLYITTLNRVKATTPTPTEISIFVYAWMTDVKLGSPTATVVQVRSESGVVYSEGYVDAMQLNDSSEKESHINEFHFGESPLSFRALLKRFVTYHEKAQLNIEEPTTVNQIVYSSSIYPVPVPNYGTFPGVSSLSAGDYNLYSYLRYAYLGMRGGMKRRSTFFLYDNDVTATHPTTIQLVSPNTRDYTTNYDELKVVNDIEYEQYSTTTGAVRFITRTNGGVEYELPFYSNNLFLYSFSDVPIGPEDPLSVGNPLDTNIDTKYSHLFNLTLSPNIKEIASGAIYVVNDIAIAEDFSFLKFVGAVPYLIRNV